MAPYGALLFNLSLTFSVFLFCMQDQLRIYRQLKTLRRDLRCGRVLTQIANVKQAADAVCRYHTKKCPAITARKETWVASRRERLQGCDPNRIEIYRQAHSRLHPAVPNYFFRLKREG